MTSLVSAYRRWPPNVRGIALMLFGTLIVTINLAFIRFLRDDLPSFELLLLRYLFALVFVAPLIFKTGPVKVFRTRRLGLYVFRGLLATISVVLWYYALPWVSLAEGIAPL